MLQVLHPINCGIRNLQKNNLFLTHRPGNDTKEAGEHRFKTSFFKPTVYLPTTWLMYFAERTSFSVSSPNRFLRRKMSALTKNAPS